MSDRPARIPAVVLAVASHDSLTVRLLNKRILKRWLRNGFHKLPIRLEYQYFIRLPTGLGLWVLIDPSSRVVTIGVGAIFCQGGAVNICPNFYEAVQKKRGSCDALTSAYISSKNIPTYESII